MSKDWVQWHQQYEDPESSLSRRRVVVQSRLRRILQNAREPAGELRIISICAGDGRDVLPVLAELDGAAAARALLVEIDPRLTDRARRLVDELCLAGVDVQTTDAGITDPYQTFAPVHIVMACGVFGNISVQDAMRTIAVLPSLLADRGFVIWTRGCNDEGPDPSDHIRELFDATGFTGVGFVAPEDARFRVGIHRLSSRLAGSPLQPGVRRFAFRH